MDLNVCFSLLPLFSCSAHPARQLDDLRGTSMSVGNMEEIIIDNHTIVSTSGGSEHYVFILSFVEKDQLEPGCSVLLNHKVAPAPAEKGLLLQSPTSPTLPTP